jgi:quercetin dioxygenase-like cupin family protein
MNIEQLNERHIPFSSLRYSTEAFIDYAIPECSPKYNYALVGPGVSQNAKQPVSLREPHGFQVGGVSMPHGRINPPHLHFSCEVFICAKGRWRIQWGFNPEARQVDIGELDIVSVPTWIYRGFTNIGVDDGFLFTALGRDHTGGILWGPATLAAAAAHGVHLTQDYRIVDTRRGDALAPGEQTLQPMQAQEIAALRDWSPAEMAQRVVRASDLRFGPHSLLDAVLPGGGAQLAPVVGLGLSEDRHAVPPVAKSHGVSLEWLRLPPGVRVSAHRLAEKQVVTVYRGRVTLQIQALDGLARYPLEGSADGWDTYAIPGGVWREFHNIGSDEAWMLMMTAGDHRKRIEWEPSVAAAAHQAGWALDADGCVAQRHFVERAQR